MTQSGTPGVTADEQEPSAATGAGNADNADPSGESTDPPSAPKVRRRLGDRIATPLRKRTLTWRLVAVLLVLMITALTMSNLTTSALMRRYLMDRTAQELQVASGPVASRSLGSNSNSNTTPSTYAIVFYDPTSGLQYSVGPSDGRFQPKVPVIALTDSRATDSEVFQLPSSQSGGPMWLAKAGVVTERNTGMQVGTYVVATSLAGIDQTVSRMMLLSTVLGLCVTGASVLIGWLGFRRAFRPLRAIEDTASAIAAGDLTRRVPQRAANDEVASLARSLNAMLAQVESSFHMRAASEARMRQFVTDASHELRTPLATVRGYAELYRQGAAASPEATAGAMRRIEDEATRMSGLVEDLLTLARLDNRRPMQLASVDLTVLAGDAVQDARARQADRTIRLVGLDKTGLAPAVMRGDEARLRQVVTNLLANALTHTPSGSPVEVAVGSAGERVRIEVRDHGKGIPTQDAPRVFERFFRKDPARGRQQQGGHGLGLAIVAAIVEAHGGRVGVAPTPGGGATFVVDLPRSAPAAPAPSTPPAGIEL
ncbi:two-component system OmpR family sensor kinase [Kineosphaera limosa]|uniref:histidine kinase n=1 Tax=Kineosphaera limosa NBRC 100340 TaxID=1184609 RepID=K6WP55_9MICO|nr:HAMP domain-containing sensor histidine kinase [Kineosphaera limosa]NYD99651.1 two-component system OmpR family sensor kinase [Kineosphaera limosa]GAB95606.1 putative two-component histidine kinase [Kineosphaera limosa NBRC 100340]